MIITKDPWVVLVLGDDISGAISRDCDDRTFLLIVGAENPEIESGFYSPLEDKWLPQPEDSSEFARVYRVAEALVRERSLSGPYAENHPATYRRFEYLAKEALTPHGLLECLALSGVAVRITDIRFSRGITCYASEESTVRARIEKEVHTEYGLWMTEETSLSLPNITVMPTEKEQEERDKAARARASELLAEIEKESRLKRLFRMVAGAIFWFLLWPFTE